MIKQSKEKNEKVRKESDDMVSQPEQLNLISIILWYDNDTQTLSYTMAMTHSSAEGRWGCYAMHYSVCFACAWWGVEEYKLCIVSAPTWDQSCV